MAITNDVLQAAARLEYEGGEDCVNVYDFQYLDIGAQTAAVTAGDIVMIIEQLYTIALSIISITTTFRDIRIRNKTSGTLLGTYAFPTLTTGSAVGDVLPHGVSQMISFPTNVPRVTLRKYLDRGTESGLIPPGVWAAAALAVQTSYAAALVAPIVTSGRNYQFGYLSPKITNKVSSKAG